MRALVALPAAGRADLRYVGRQPIGSALRDAKLEVLIQLSLVASFSVVTVIVPLVACLEALLDFRGDAWCLVRATRRPIPQRRSARRSVGRRGAAELEIGDGDGGVV